MGKYVEYKKARQEELNNLPIWFAYTKEQFNKEMLNRGLSPATDKDKLYRIGNNCFYLRKDADVVEAYYNKDTRGELFKKISESKSFALDAFKYEMKNHEYPINWQGDWDVCSCFGVCEYADSKTGEDYLRELGFADHVIAIWQQARKEVCRYEFD